MSQRNFILLIIFSVLAVLLVLGILLFAGKNKNPEDDNTEGTNFISQFNPFGRKPAAPESTPPTNVQEAVAPTFNTENTQLTKVSTMPVAGFTVFEKERLVDLPAPAPVSAETQTENTQGAKPADISKKIAARAVPPPTEFMPALRYVDKATGNIYQTFADKLEERKFSVTIIPRVHEAYFGSLGQSVVMRYLKADGKTIETFVGTLPKEVLGADTMAENEVKGSFLPNDVKDLSISPDATKILYFFESGSAPGSILVGTTLNLLNNKKTQIFESRFTEWLSFWPANNLISLSTKPSAGVPGYMYTMDSAGKNLKKVLGGINGLTTLGSPDGKMILYGDSNLFLSIYNMGTNSANILNIKTLPEKCVWGKTSSSIYCAVPKSISAGEYPDSWYQGEVSFRDVIWKIDVETGNADLIFDPASLGDGEIDAMKLTLDKNEHYLFFLNKKDYFLWKLDLE